MDVDDPRECDQSSVCSSEDLSVSHDSNARGNTYLIVIHLSLAYYDFRSPCMVILKKICLAKCPWLNMPFSLYSTHCSVMYTFVQSILCEWIDENKHFEFEWFQYSHYMFYLKVKLNHNAKLWHRVYYLDNRLYVDLLFILISNHLGDSAKHEMPSWCTDRKYNRYMII